MDDEGTGDGINLNLENGFDLNIDERFGNCVTCFKKSDRHLMTIAKHDKSWFDFNRRMEKKY